MEQLLNRYLAKDPASFQRLSPLAGKVIGFSVEQTPFQFSFHVSQGSIQVADGIAEDCNAVIHSSPLALLRLADTDESELMFKGRIRIDGDTEVGHRFKQVLAGVDIDWEEQLSLYTGDVIAHQIGRFLQHGKDWLQDSRQRLDNNLKEYLQEEIRLLPQQEEIEQFMSDVDTLRADMDRLQARFDRLQRLHSAREQQP